MHRNHLRAPAPRAAVLAPPARAEAHATLPAVVAAHPARAVALAALAAAAAAVGAFVTRECRLPHGIFNVSGLRACQQKLDQ